MTHNPIRPWRNIERRVSRQIHVGKVPVGGDAPIAVQTMTNTLTHDVKATLEQIQRAAIAGADIVRVSTPDVESTSPKMSSKWCSISRRHLDTNSTVILLVKPPLLRCAIAPKHCGSSNPCWWSTNQNALRRINWARV